MNLNEYYKTNNDSTLMALPSLFKKLKCICKNEGITFNQGLVLITGRQITQTHKLVFTSTDIKEQLGLDLFSVKIVSTTFYYVYL